jgi:hypothetical protein
VNGDGFSDLAIGAPAYDIPAFDIGKVYVYYSPAGQANSPILSKTITK